MRHRIPLIALAAIVAAGPLAAAAQTSPPAPVAAAPAAVTPKTEALVRRMMKAMKVENQVDQMLGAMLPVMAEQQFKANPQLTEADRALIVETTRQVMREEFTPKLLARAVPIYAATFNESELEQIVAFYESPPGRSIIEKMPSLGPKIAEAARELMPELAPAMMRAICGKVNCAAPPAGTMPKPKPS